MIPFDYDEEECVEEEEYFQHPVDEDFDSRYEHCDYDNVTVHVESVLRYSCHEEVQVHNVRDVHDEQEEMEESGLFFRDEVVEI